LISLKPEYADAYYWRSVAKQNLGLDEEAKNDFRKAHELEPKRFKLDDGDESA